MPCSNRRSNASCGLPLFVIIFSILGFAGITVKLFLGYDTEMKKHEEGAIWNRKQGEG